MMSRETALSIGQAHELDLAFRRTNWTNEDIHRLIDGGILQSVLGVVRGTHEVREIERIIDLSRDPELPFPGTRIKRHSDGGLLRLIKDGGDLLLGEQRIIPTPAQNCAGGSAYGNSVFMILEDGKPVSACVLDYMVRHPEIWPQILKDGRPALFWGHTYADDEREYVRMGYWKDGSVRSHYEPIRRSSNGSRITDRARGDTIHV